MVTPALTFNEQIAVRTLYGECRGEPSAEQLAIAHVLYNRADSGHWGYNLAQVCLAPYQFSCWLPKDPNWKLITQVSETDPLFQSLYSVLLSANTTADPTSGATHYYATSMTTPPSWVLGATYCGLIGKTKFYKDVK